jgi:flagellar biosynthesis protein FlhA
MADQKQAVPGWARLIARHSALIVPLGFVSLLGVLLVPLSPVVMDVLIAFNICVAVIVLMTTMYMNHPLDFSVFPSLLLATTLLRLVINIASTRLILTADASSPQQVEDVAGKVISAFGSFVAGGDAIVGVIIFIILVVVQFIVITKGATRISEVAARFTLDAMPGKQMAIDADLNAGVIDEAEARQRRDDIAREADFFGAMDGASKFVRGDAVAGIIITIVNIIGGFAIGALDKGWSPGETARAFTILTIGDGIASQIPSFVIAVAAALIVTRSSARGSLGEDFTGQLTSRPAALLITSAFVALLGLTPLPAPPLFALAIILFAIAFFSIRGTREAARQAEEVERREVAETQPEGPAVEDLLKVDTLELEVGYGLVSLVDANQGGDLLDRISAIRRQLAAEIGLVMPPVRIRDNMTLTPNQYRVRIRGATVAEGETHPGMLLAMDSGIASGPIQGEKTVEPAFGLDAWWIAPNLKQRAETMNYTVVDPTSVLTTHVAEIVKNHGDELLTREEVNNLLEQLKRRAPKLVEDTVPEIVSPGDLQKVMQALLRERVPIRDLETILETLADWGTKTKDADILVEYARNALRRSICQIHATPIDPETASSPGARHRIVCVTLDPAFEDFVGGFIDRDGASTTLSIPSSVASGLARRVSAALGPVVNAGHAPVVLASPQVRAPIRQMLEPFVQNVAVLGFNEIVAGVEIESKGLVTLPEEEPAASAAG